MVGKAEKQEPVGWLLFWSSTLAQCQTHSSAVGVGVNVKMLLLAGGSLFLFALYLQGERKILELPDWWVWEQKFFAFFLSIIAVFATPHNFSKQQPAEVDEGSYLV